MRNLFNRFRIYKKALLKRKIPSSKDLEKFIDDPELDEIYIEKERLHNMIKTFYLLDERKRAEIIERVDQDIKTIKEMMGRLEGLFRIEYPIKNDSKIKELKSLLKKNLEENKPTIVFSQWADSVEYIRKCLEKDDEIKDNFDFIHGKTKRSKDKLIRDFERGKIDIIVSTDVLSEGVNLPRADCVVNFDLPYNPVLLVQRAGRALRITNPKKITIVNFKPEDSIDKEIDLYKKLMDRVNNMINIIGIDFIFWMIEEKNVKKLKDEELQKYFDYCKEYKKNLAKKNPEDFMRQDVSEEDKINKVLRKSVDRFKMNLDFLEKFSPDVGKPFYTSLKEEAGVVIFVESNGYKKVVGEVKDSLEESHERMDKHDKESINKIIEEESKRAKRELVSRYSPTREEQKLIRRLTEIMERLSEENRGKVKGVIRNIQNRGIHSGQKEKVRRFLEEAEKVPEFIGKIDNEIKQETWNEIREFELPEVKPVKLRLLAGIKYTGD